VGRPLSEQGARRLRLALAAILAATLTGLIAVALLSAGDDSGKPAEAECIDAWNDDPLARTLGVHQSGAHGYLEAHVLRLADDGGAPRPRQQGRCAVAFAADTLDPEARAAAQLQFKGTIWRPVSDLPGVTPERLLELQHIAAEEPNANLAPTGTIDSR
jgi:hypothetical protein